MSLVLTDKNAGRTRPRPSSPGSHILWWDRLRGALADLAAPTRPGRSEQGSVARPALPALYQPPIEQREAYLAAVGRAAGRARQAHP